jgi:hypothetical protein
LRNAHPRDSYVQFTQKGHRYSVTLPSESAYTNKGTHYVSATGLINQFFKTFDADSAIAKMMNSKNWVEGHRYWGMSPTEIKQQWKELGQESAMEGTKLHEYIESFYNAPDYNSSGGPTVSLPVSFECIENFRLFHTEVVEAFDYTPYRTEWRIFDEEYCIAGSLDMLFKPKPLGPPGYRLDNINLGINLTGVDSQHEWPDDWAEREELHLYDWKRVMEFQDENIFQSGLGPLSHIPDAKFW